MYGFIKKGLLNDGGMEVNTLLQSHTVRIQVTFASFYFLYIYLFIHLSIEKATFISVALLVIRH